MEGSKREGKEKRKQKEVGKRRTIEGEDRSWGRGRFVKYLPQDEAVAAGLRVEGGSDPLESQRVFDLLNQRLSDLLSLPPPSFCSFVAKDSSLHGFLESFLQFRSRWYDFPHRGVRGIVAGVIVGELELSKRVFMVLYRLSSNRDPGARAADSLSSKDHTVLLQETKLLDMPKLFDICAIYGHENEDLTRALVLNALNAQPWIQDEIIFALSHFLNIVHTMHQRCSASLEVLGPSLGNVDHGSSRLHEDYLEVMDFINDSIVSMDAFVCAYKPAAVVLSCPVETSSGNDDLLNTLAKLHDSLLPSFQRVFRIIFTSEKGGVEKKNREMLSNIILSLKMLSIRIAKFGWKLLDISYLSDEVFNGEFSLPNFTKMFPAKVEDPGIRADILVQTFREINGGYLHLEEGHGKETFLQRVEKENRILERVELLQKTGWVALDDEQFQYFTGIMKHHWGTNTQMPNIPTLSAINNLQVDEDTAIIESKISQIKDIFPDYANSFLSACVEVYNYNPEEVIQRILEGDLHPDLQLLDPTQEIISPSTLSTLSKNGKGKGKLIEFVPPSSSSMVPKNRDRQCQSPSISTSSSTGRFVRKSTVVSPDSVTLDCRDERDMAKTGALISQQLEYDDEYDDSFDDLGLGVPDSGFDETESGGEKLNSAPSDSSKWGSRNKPQFFVKDGKNYSYKVKDSVGVANFNEAAIINQAQKEQIHGLGRGGNIPLGAVKKMTEWNVEREDEGEGDDVAESGGRGVPGNFRGRGRRGGGGGRSNHYRKDRAMKKHFTGVSGF